mgnify:CR=1 FL=1
MINNSINRLRTNEYLNKKINFAIKNIKIVIYNLTIRINKYKEIFTNKYSVFKNSLINNIKSI